MDHAINALLMFHTLEMMENATNAGQLSSNIMELAINALKDFTNITVLATNVQKANSSGLTKQIKKLLATTALIP